MRPTPSTLKLPAKLVDELGGYDVLARNTTPRDIPTSRKDRRKADRVQRKTERSGIHPLKRQKLRHPKPIDTESPKVGTQDDRPITLPPKKPVLTVESKSKSLPSNVTPSNEPVEDTVFSLQSSQLPINVPRHVVARLAQDDAEIAALEKKLGIKSKQHLPREFKDDGLDELLESVGGNLGTISQINDTDEVGRIWLARKRSAANVTQADERSELPEDDAAIDFEDDFQGFDSESDEIPSSQPLKRERENPYIAPTPHGSQAHPKYIPPSLREPSSDDEDLRRLRRQAQGLVNRLTEANLISILNDVEKLYRDNARKHVTSTLVDLLMTSVCEPTTLPDTLIILPAGFITAIYKVIGTDFGAQVVERAVTLFDEHYSRASNTDNNQVAASGMSSSKETSNLITLLAELYNFQFVGSKLIFDYIRLFLHTLSELNAELLLRIVRVSGPQLRQDDPSSLRDIITMLRHTVDDVGEQNLSVRMKFMIESINDLKNNRLRTGVTASSVNSEHIVQMKKILGALNTRNIMASEPLRIGLRDIQESDRKGKWWLVGASWVGNGSNNEPNHSENTLSRKTDDKIGVDGDKGSSDLVQLARELRMNTDIRRAIFVTIMSASDYQDAYMRLLRLKLKKVQELEIPKVIIHCASAEKTYNPYYTLIAQKLCSDRRLRMAFQFSLWDLFKRLGEANHNGEVLEINEDEEILDTRRIVNYAKMFGSLIVQGGISLTVLKHLNLRYLQPKTKTLVEVLLVTVILQTQLQSKISRDEQALIGVFSKTKDTPSIARSLLFFLRKVVAKTDVAGGKTETETVKWACKVAASTLRNVLTVETVYS